MEDTPEEAVSEFFERIDNYTDSEIERLLSKFDPIAQVRECPR